MENYSDLTVIIPTLNEAKNIRRLISLLVKNYKNLSIIVSDDGSNDGTKEAVIEISRKNKNVIFLDRSKKETHGLTASVLDGAIVAKTKKLIIMDGDMQHPFEKVGELAKGLDNHDIMIGVRRNVRNWGISRKIVSKSISSFSYVVFKARNKHVTNDMMSGFFGIRANFFKSIIKKDRKSFIEKGYKVLLDVLRVADKKTKVGEIYYDTFHDRIHGKSKLGINQVSNTLKSTLK